jgi:hypothetical protein
METVRTTLTIDRDVLETSRYRAKARGVGIGKALSDLARAGLRADQPETGIDAELARLGIMTFPDRGVTVTPLDVERLMDEEGV